MAEAAQAGKAHTLADELARCPLQLAEILALGGGIARALARLHAAGQLHLDLCPAKVHWIRSDSEFEVQLGPLQDRGGDHEPFVSIDPGYASPELLEGGSADARSDLFSLGCILYAMSTGHGPFWGATPADVARSVREVQPRPVCQLNPRLPAWTGAVIMKLLAKDPQRRYSDAAQLADMLSLQASMAGVVRRPPPRSLSERPAAVRVPIGSVLAATASEPVAAANGAGNRQPAVEPPEPAASPDPVTPQPKSAYWRRALLAGIVALPVLVAAALLAVWWPTPAGTSVPNQLADNHAANPPASTQGEQNAPAAATPLAGRESKRIGLIDFTPTTAVGSRKGEVFEELSDSLDPLIGFDIMTIEDGGFIASIQAIYRSDGSIRLGQVFGAPKEAYTRIEAPRGYAVGGILVRGGSHVEGLRIRFMRQMGDGLDQRDSLDSEWIGRPGTKGEKLLGGNGRLVIGIHGRTTNVLQSLGLMQAIPADNDRE